jgi:hypothetical protein
MLVFYIEMAKRAAEIKNKRETMRLIRNATSDSSKASEHFVNSQYQHTDFLKAIIEQQKLVQQQEAEHKQKLALEQQVNRQKIVLLCSFLFAKRISTR